jgi:hypothetical protein
MSTGIVLTGKRGDGKSLAAVGRMREYLQRGCAVATNLNIWPEMLVAPDNRKLRIYRLPDHPTISDLEALPRGTDSKDEERNGLLVIDEAATMLNSRTWSADVGHRQAVISWYLHSRKYGWDLIFLSQHVSLLDKQMRDALFELHGACKRLDKVAIPFVTPLAKQFGLNVKMPKIHVATVRYGTLQDSPVFEKWWYRGRDLYRAYDTNQVIDPTNGIGLHCLLTPWHLRGRFMSRLRMYGKAVMTGLILGLFAGAFGLSVVGKSMGYKRESSIVDSIKTDSSVFVTGYSLDRGMFHVFLSDGTFGTTTEYDSRNSMLKFRLNGKWYALNKGGRS